MTYWIITWADESQFRVACDESERDKLIKNLLEEVDPDTINVYESQTVYRVAVKLEKI